MSVLRSNKKRKLTQWLLVPIFLIVITFGWKYPLLGFVVPIVMFTGMIGGMINGRYVCGNLCPRGSFFDRFLMTVSQKRCIPEFLKNKIFRLVVFIALMALMIYRITINPGEINHWGRVFLLMCVVTSIVGVILGIFYHQRSWCAMCPMGSMQNVLGGAKQQLKIDSHKCVSCGLCEKACPMTISIMSYKESGAVSDRDCLKCRECVEVCPKKALS